MQLRAGGLSAVVGLGVWDRAAGSPAERARVNIIKSHQDRPGPDPRPQPALADHLNPTIHTGAFCCCTPDPRAPVTWRT